MKSSQVPLKNLPMVGTTMVGHIHIMIIELLMKLDVILKNVGCTVTKMLDHNSVFDTITHEKLFEATGNMGSEQLYTDSAAEAVLKISGDHPVDGGESSKLSGVGYYPYR